MDDKQRKRELSGLRKTLNSIVTGDFDQENETIRETIRTLEEMIKEREIKNG